MNSFVTFVTLFCYCISNEFLFLIAMAIIEMHSLLLFSQNKYLNFRARNDLRIITLSNN